MRERSILRKLVAASDEISTNAFSPQGKDIATILDEAEQKIFKIGEQGSRMKEGFQSMDTLVVSLLEAFSPVERRLAAHEEGAARVHDFHRYLFDQSLDSIRSHVKRSTGVELQSAIAHIDTATGSVLKTFTTNPAVELFLLGQGLPALGVPVNTHLHANGANGNGAVCN